MFLKRLHFYSNFGFLKYLKYQQTLNNSKIYASLARCVSSDIKSIDKRDINLNDFLPDRVRNFSIVAHVDHGKSTLADRLLEITGTIPTDVKNEQVLDKLEVERERGITIKAQTASLIFDHNNETYLLNLIDTPGHVDFHYEVSRSLAACQGVVLLVDANEGVQAQTLANFYKAFEAELTIVPVINKIDLKNARPDAVAQQMEQLFDIKTSEILKISAKNCVGIKEVLAAIVERIPPPKADRNKVLRAQVIDSWFEQYRGVVCLISLKDGSLKKGDKITFSNSGLSYDVQEVGILNPNNTPTESLYAGQVGYLYCNLKTITEACVGDTLFHQKYPVEPLSNIKAVKPMVFAGIYPVEQLQYEALKTAINKLTLNDASVSIATDSSAALGAGWRLGFLGLLHMDVFTQRLEVEFGTSSIITSPNVLYKVRIKGADNIKQYRGEMVDVLNPCLLPDPSIITEYHEPMVIGTVVTPAEYIGKIITLIRERSGIQQDQVSIDEKRVLFKAIFPLREIIVDFFDELKSLTSGYASFDYEDCGYQLTDLVKVEIYLNGRHVEEMTQLTHREKARDTAKHMVARLKQTIPQQLFAIAIQAKVGSRVVARDDLKALRKDVLAKCYGGDVTRKMKLLRRQAEGKKRMRLIGNIEVPKEAFISIMKK